MKKINYFLLAGSLFIVSCQHATEQKQNHELDSIKKEVLAVHDKIMPQISVFHQQTLQIDSMLVHVTADSTKTAELLALKVKLEQAVGLMSNWMKDYSLDSTIDYQQQELEKVNTMKKIFDDAVTASKSVW